MFCFSQSLLSFWLCLFTVTSLSRDPRASFKFERLRYNISGQARDITSSPEYLPAQTIFMVFSCEKIDMYFNCSLAPHYVCSISRPRDHDRLYGTSFVYKLVNLGILFSSIYLAHQFFFFISAQHTNCNRYHFSLFHLHYHYVSTIYHVSCYQYLPTLAKLPNFYSIIPP